MVKLLVGSVVLGGGGLCGGRWLSYWWVVWC